MKTVKYILAAGLCISSIMFTANAQTKEDVNKNSFRIGGGVNICRTDYQGETVSAGPSFTAEYSRYLNRYFSAGANVHYGLCKFDSISSGNKFGLDVRGMARPFAFTKWLRWLEVGVGLSCEYMFSTYGDTSDIQNVTVITGTEKEEVSYYNILQDHSCHFGFDFPVRAYFINSSRFELFAFYEFRTAFYKGGRFGLDHSICGLMFGVKF